jgi:hypothetical protein
MHQRSCGRDPRIEARSTIGMTAAPPALPGRACDKRLKESHEFTCPLLVKSGHGRRFDVDALQGDAHPSV